MTEEWRKIKGYENYEVSNTGKVRSLNYKKLGYVNELKPNTTQDYYYVSLYKEGIIKSFKIHRLVAEAFLDNPENLPVINHKNGIKNDNRIENLAFCTYSQNTIHAFEMGLIKGRKGEKHHHCKLNKEDISTIKEKYSTGNFTLKQLGDDYKVSFQHISLIVRNKTWN